ncbi:MAG: hypothetical protein JOZ96_01855 [Acidobacteria bacterium]|nr:hypothetical protein [Acidobacteriota bacterium]
MSNQERTDSARAAAPRARTLAVWPESQQGLPAQEPTVRLIFHGLLCILFDGSSGCFVGTHNTSAHAGHPHPHRYVIQVWRREGGVCHSLHEPYDIGDPKSASRLDVRVANPDLIDGTYVYTRDPFERPDPAGGNDPHDWRWVIDFDDMYPGGVTLNPDAVMNGVTINNGLFYTLRKTCSKFLFRPEDDDSGASDTQLGSVAHYVAANIYLKPDDGAVTLSGGPFDVPLTLRPEPGVTFQVDITNNCNDGDPGCQFDSDPAQPKEKRSDFFLYYEAFDQGDEPELELILSDPCPKLLNIDAEFIEMGVCPSSRVRSSDDTPCGAVGASQTPPP